MRTDVLEVAGVSDTNVEYAEVIDMKISEEAHRHIAFAFSNIYNDPETAVIREYIANAVDATRTTGGSIEVIAPTDTIPVFVVRDEGTGMDMDTIRDVYSGYFSSTKNTSSDDIGGWGIGAKSGLAVADQFSVTTTKDGTRIKMTVTKTGSAMPQILVESVTEVPGKPSGTAISIPVDSVYRFNDKLRKFLFFMGTENITVTNLETYRSYKDTINADPNEFFYGNPQFRLLATHEDIDDSGTSIHMFSSSYPRRIEDGVYVVMGGVYYLIPESALTTNLGQELRNAARLMSGNITIIEANIDSVDLSPNREGVQFTEKTRKFVVGVLESFYEKAIRGIVDSVAGAGNLHEAIKIYRENVSLFPTGTPEWNGISLNINCIYPDGGFNVLWKNSSNEYVNLPYVSLDRINIGFYNKDSDPGTDITVIRGAKSISSAKTAFKEYIKNNSLPYAKVVVIDRAEFKTYKKEVIPSRFSEVLGMDKFIEVASCGREAAEYTHQDILKENREYRKKHQVKRPSARVSGQERRLNTTYTTYTPGVDPRYGAEYSSKSLRSIIETSKSRKTMYVDSTSFGLDITHHLHDLANFISVSGEDLIIVNLSVSGARAVKDFEIEFPEAEKFTAAIAKRLIRKSLKITKSDVHSAIRHSLGKIIGLDWLNSDYDAGAIKDPLVRKMIENSEIDDNRIRVIESASTIGSRLGLFDASKDGSDMYKAIRRSLSPTLYRWADILEWVDRLEVKGYDGLETRLEFLIKNRGRNSIEGNERYINADYDAYKKGLKK